MVRGKTDTQECKNMEDKLTRALDEDTIDATSKKQDTLSISKIQIRNLARTNNKKIREYREAMEIYRMREARCV